jgi:hypothetical protein
MERLYESYIFDYTQYTRLDEQQVADRSLKVQLQESITQPTNEDIIREIMALKEANGINNPVFDSVISKLKEVGVNANKTVWKLPIGRWGNLNGNKRVYTKKLWENVRDRQQSTWKRMFGLVDHPIADNDPGLFKDAGIVWLDMDVGDDGVVYGYGTFVGKGKVAEEILEAGGRVGFSSSGFGDVDKYTHEVDPETYVIERLADIVNNPSQGVYGSAECPHTASDFMNNVHNAATIEFSKQRVKEAREVREAREVQGRSKIMAVQQKFDAANPAGQPQAQQPNTVPPQQPQSQPAAAPQGAAPAAPQGGAQQPQQQKESVEMSQTKGTLTKVEEKAFRKYVASFLDDANHIENPIKRLNECMDILDCFEEGNCPDLKSQLQEQLLKEKIDLEKLVENVVKTESDYEMPLSKFRASAERNTAQGLLLKEQVTDYKELCEGIAERNRALKEENDRLKKKILIRDKLTEKKILLSNKEIVSSSSEIDKLQENVKKLTERNSVLVERVSKLAQSNKEFEKENGLLSTKLKEAGSIFKNVKEKDAAQTIQDKKAAQLFKALKEEIADLKDVNKRLTENYELEVSTNEKLQESFDSFKKEVNDTYNPVAHLVPKFEERVGKYLNLRENKGIEVESYWSDLISKYGESVKPFEKQIRDVKTLREATNAFLKYRTEIDPNFAVAQPAEYAYRNRDERRKLYEYQGQPDIINDYAKSSIEQKNEAFLSDLKRQGLN